MTVHFEQPEITHWPQLWNQTKDS